MNASDGTNPNKNNPNPSRSNNQRKGKGRQKLSMEKIENEKNLQVTFSKRRAGIFKKASELSTLCGAESAVVVFSPGEKSHSYGHPSVETIANRFLNTNIGPPPPTNPLLASHHEASNRLLNQELVRLEELLAREKQRKRELDDTFQPRIEEMNFEELKWLQNSVLGFKSIFESRLKEAKSLGSSIDFQGSNLEQGGPNPSVGFTNPMTDYPNAGDPTHWVGTSSSSYPAPLDPNMGYAAQYPYGAGGASGSNVLIPYNFRGPRGEALFGDMTTTTSNVEARDETQVDVSNMPRGRGSRHNNGRGGHS